MVKQILNSLKQSASLKWRSFYILPSTLIVCTFFLALISLVHIFINPYNFTEKEINIPKSARTWDTLTRLYSEGVLPHPLISIGGALFINGSPKIIAGDYVFKAGASPQKMMIMLQKGLILAHRLTFPEGWTIHAILTEINGDIRLSGSISDPIPEGSIFPSTYYIHRNQDRNQLIQTMTETMNKVTDELMKSNQNPFIKTTKDLIIFASILEREAATPGELPQIAGVFINRLKIGMRLQSDPTVIYGMTLGKSSLGRPVNRQDLKVDSDHNTYTRPGLPKGPICCPGLAALEAAAHPSTTNELYFILEHDGKAHRFSITYKEHLEHIRRIRNALKVANE
ncbi:MAG: endolytic transglycosylase MltG [Alphaproteobacteria bacterium]|nr:endolytic transglycosylase MltG [Alphaproteobacteria bacterium]